MTRQKKPDKDKEKKPDNKNVLANNDQAQTGGRNNVGRVNPEVYRPRRPSAGNDNQRVECENEQPRLRGQEPGPRERPVDLVGRSDQVHDFLASMEAAMEAPMDAAVPQVENLLNPEENRPRRPSAGNDNQRVDYENGQPRLHDQEPGPRERPVDLVGRSNQVHDFLASMEAAMEAPMDAAVPEVENCTFEN